MDHWLAQLWPEVLIVTMAAIKILNLVTRHFDDYRGVRRWCLFILDLLDVVKSSYGGLPGSMPPGSKPTREGKQ